MSTPAASAAGSAPPQTRPRRRRAALRAWIAPACGLIVATLAWDLAIRIFDIKPFILPPPLAVLQSLRDDFPSLMQHAWVTLEEVLAGFALGVAVGMPLAVLLVSWPGVERATHPLLVGAQVVPKIAIAPLFMVWLGFGMAPKILVAFLFALFPIVIDSVLGLRSLETEKIYLARSMGASSWQTFVRFRLPNAMPNIFAGLKLAITFAVTGAVVGEFIGADRGLGRAIVVASGNLETAAVFAAVLILAAMGIVLFLLVDATERLVLRWHVSQRSVQAPDL